MKKQAIAAVSSYIKCSNRG